MKNIFGLLGAIALFTNMAFAAPVQPAQTPIKQPTPAITVGLPLNVTGVSAANRPDILNFATVNTNNTVEINWKNICSLTTSHKMNLQNDLPNFKGEIVVYLLPYMLENANPEQCKNK